MNPADRNTPENDRSSHDSGHRMARCAMNCGSTVESSPGLPFFYGKPEEPFDSYYDGCLGWD